MGFRNDRVGFNSIEEETLGLTKQSSDGPQTYPPILFFERRKQDIINLWSYYKDQKEQGDWQQVQSSRPNPLIGKTPTKTTPNGTNPYT